MISNMAQVFFLFIWLFIKFMRYSSYLIYHSNTTMHMFYWQERLLFVKQIPLDPISYMINPLSYKINLTFIRQFPMWLGPSITRSVLNFVTCLWMNIWKVFVCSPRCLHDIEIWFWIIWCACGKVTGFVGGKDQVDLIK